EGQIVEQLENGSSYAAWSELSKSLFEALKSQGDNVTSELEPFVVQFVDGKREWWRGQESDLHAEAERRELEELRNDPNFKEVPDRVANAFENIDMVAKVNMETIRVYKRQRERFSLWLIQANDPAGGLLKRYKEDLKRKWGAMYYKGEGKYRGSWWAIPTRYGLDEVYEFLSDRLQMAA
ncbi:MAG: hypothetical protein GY866_28960, partial [Proteobacteria bacterium]|nr:hypothetical protein [Pseudomonadota bacterium]